MATVQSKVPQLKKKGLNSSKFHETWYFSLRLHADFNILGSETIGEHEGTYVTCLQAQFKTCLDCGIVEAPLY